MKKNRTQNAIKIFLLLSAMSDNALGHGEQIVRLMDIFGIGVVSVTIIVVMKGWKYKIITVGLFLMLHWLVWINIDSSFPYNKIWRFVSWLTIISDGAASLALIIVLFILPGILSICIMNGINKYVINKKQ